MDVRSIRRKLARWYQRAKRDLPWRRTRDPYAIWVSEIMLQQTRVAAVIPYYERFLQRFPDVGTLAAAPEADLLAAWSGLGYYSRARNLQTAAKDIAARGGFPGEHGDLLNLAGIGEYTAAALASIAFGRPHAAVDGNVRRVIARLANDGDADTAAVADELLDRRDPGAWNQAMMELGATICIPRDPLCEACPIAGHCAARAAGRQNELPRKKTKADVVHTERTLLVIRRGGRIVLVPSPRVRGFWELPEPFPGARCGVELGSFAHAITNTRYQFRVREATMVKSATKWVPKNGDRQPISPTRAERGGNVVAAKLESVPIFRQAPLGVRWFAEARLPEIPLSTVTKKALALVAKVPG